MIPAPPPALWRRVVVAGVVPALPRLTAVARGEGGAGYQHDTARRKPGCVAVQITLAGCGGLRRGDAAGAAAQPIPRGTALVFRTAVDRLTYGPLVPDIAWRFVYADLAGATALTMADGIVAALGNIIPVSPTHPAVRALLALDRDSGQRESGQRSDIHMSVARSAQLALDLLVMLAEALPAEDAPEARLAAAALTELERRVAGTQALPAAAHALGVSREHMGRCFKRAYGETPSEWLRHRRLELAASLLTDRSRSIAEIAGACGFATASHFVHAFSAARGLTPGAFRKHLPQ